MTNYSKTTNFTAKDSLVSGDANKIVKGSEIDAEFDNIATASATKANTASPTFTGVVSFPDGTAGDPSITNTGDTNTGLFFSAADTLAFSSAGTAQFTMADGAIAPVTDNDVDLGTSSLEFKDGYFDGTLYTDAINLDGTAITSTAAEINILDGVTATAAELNILDGVTSTAAELNILDGVTSTAAELNILDGVTATTAELNYSDTGSAVGTVVASKVVTVDANKDVASFRNITLTGELDAGSLDISGDADIDGTLETDALSINGTAVTATAAELNILDGVTSTAAELNILDGVTSTTAELNILDGVTSTAAELNILDGKAFLDEDDMSSNSATGIASQQSIKAYVDAQITAEDLDFQADSGGALSIDLDSETLTFTGGTGIDTSGSGNAVTFAIDSTVATLTGSQTLTNKTLTSPDINTPDIDGGTIDGTTIGASTAAAGTFTTFTSNGIDDNADAIAITIDSSEKVSIGAAVGTEKLNVSDSVTVSGYIYPTTDNGWSLGLSTNRWGSVFAQTADFENSVGIGTSSPSSYYAKELVVSAADEGGVTIVGGTGQQNYLMFADGTSGGERFRGYLGYDHDGDIMQLTSGGIIKFLSNDTTEAMRISGGNVGIGVSNPSSYTAGANDLVVGGSGSQGITIASGTSSTGNLFFADSTSGNAAYRGYVQYQHNGDKLVFGAASDDRVFIDSNGVGIGVTPSAKLDVGGNITLNGAAGTSPIFEMINNDNEDTDTGRETSIRFSGHRSGGEDVINAQISAHHDGSADDEKGMLFFYTNNGSGLNLAQKIDSSGVITQTFAVSSETVMKVFNNNTSSGAKYVVSFRQNGSQVGAIEVGTSSTSYLTSSDYRLKEDVQPMSGATARLKALKPVNFAWAADGSRVDGFLAHEAQEVVPEAVSGSKDGMQTEEYEVSPAEYDEEGNVVADAVMGEREVPNYQGIDQSKLVPLLVATIQELEARITQLENN